MDSLYSGTKKSHVFLGFFFAFPSSYPVNGAIPSAGGVAE